MFILNGKRRSNGKVAWAFMRHCARLAMLALCFASTTAWGGFTWETRKTDAISKAKSSGKYVFLVCGTDTCPNTSGTRADCEALGSQLTSKCVVWYCNLDKYYSEAKTYISDMKGQILMPIVCLIDPNNSAKYIARTNGRMYQDDILDFLKKIPAQKSKYTVKFNANGGEAAETKRSVKKNAVVGTLPSATLKGYKLKGWYTKASGGTKISAKTKVTKNVTYYAQWTANKYTIKFNANGGTGSMKSLSATYGKQVTLTANAFKRSGRTFAGWAKSKSATAVKYKNKQKVKNLTSGNGKTVTLYAVWYPADWVFGTYVGEGAIDEEEMTVKVKVKTDGKISGKFIRKKDKTSFPFSSKKFTGLSGDVLTATSNLEYGNDTIGLEISFFNPANYDAPCVIWADDRGAHYRIADNFSKQ